MVEVLRKVGLYFRSPRAYHAPSASDPRPLAVATGPLGRYYIDETMLLDFGHWSTFDENGIPLRLSRDGSAYLHKYSTIASYALAHADMYLLTGDTHHVDELVKVCDYVLATVDRSGGAWTLRREEASTGAHTGSVSAINHGQWMSALCRAWQVTDHDEYLDAAAKLVGMMTVPLSAGGVLGHIGTDERLPWYEEEAVSNFHILNGMICTLWGLLDTATVADDPGAKERWETGVDSMTRALPLFDAGYWSWYGISEQLPDYIASMEYHGLHICQLEILADQTDDPTIRQYATRFNDYAGRPLNRLAAGAKIAIMKSRGLERYRGSEGTVR